MIIDLGGTLLTQLSLQFLLYFFITSKQYCYVFVYYRSVILTPATAPSTSRGTKTYDFETNNRLGHELSKRSTSPMLVNVTLLQYLDTGRWFLSVYNDDLRPHEVVLIVEEAEGISTACPNDCSGHGSCYLGKCDCIDGFEGIDCAKSKYSVFIINL